MRCVVCLVVWCGCFECGVGVSACLLVCVMCVVCVYLYVCLGSVCVWWLYVCVVCVYVWCECVIFVGGVFGVVWC